jgi:hypothetical protein
VRHIPGDGIKKEIKMENTQTLNRNFSKIGDGALLIWWGIVMMIHPLTIGMGAVGTGLILLGVNAARLLKGIPAKRSTTALGVSALMWGAFDMIFQPHFESSLAMMLIVIGVVSIASLVARPNAE